MFEKKLEEMAKKLDISEIEKRQIKKELEDMKKKVEISESEKNQIKKEMQSKINSQND